MELLTYILIGFALTLTVIAVFEALRKPGARIRHLQHGLALLNMKFDVLGAKQDHQASRIEHILTVWEPIDAVDPPETDVPTEAEDLPF